MGRKKNKENNLPKLPSITEVVAISIKIQIDNFIKDEEETELVFPSSLSKKERAFVHEKARVLGLQSKSAGTGPKRFITVYKKTGSSIIQKDAQIILSSSMQESINTLLMNYPITLKEKEDLLSGCERDRGYSLPRESSYLANLPCVPNTFTNPDVINFKRELPVYSFKDQILNLIKANQVTIVFGETGSGKTTQIPQYILDQYQQEKRGCRIICTQPRRISAVSVADRVAYERNESVGHSIGYQIRLESKHSPKTVLTYCTCGVLLRTLMSGANVLSNITHIIVDEVHVRDKLTDFLLISLKEVLPKFQDLRVVLMSATIDHTMFSKYFNNCPVISIPGRLYDVEQFFLDNILDMTGYFSKDMEKARRSLGYAKPHNSSENTPEEKLEKIDNEMAKLTLDPELQVEFDDFLNDCFNDGSVDAFGQIMYMYMSENVPVNCKHTMSGITGLMAAAFHSANETVEQLVQMGADPSIKDNQGKTAIDYAILRENNECAQFLEYVVSGLLTPQGQVKESEEAQLDNELLDMYLQSVSDDTIDYNLIIHVVQYIHLTQPIGSILIFVSGYEDIISLRTLIESNDEMNKMKYQIFTLHSNMQTSDQKKVFARMSDTRKIILSTNIAETSITISDVVYVIDSAKAKELYFEPASGACSLQLIWVSKACCRQRAGRAGRLQNGKCFTLCSKQRFTSLQENSIPEILRAPLHELCLQTKRLAPTNTPIADFLSKAIEPPVFSAVRNSVNLLKTIGALTPMENLTELGQLLLDLPVEPHLGKMLIFAVVFKCLDPILTITSSLSFNEPFQIGSSLEARKKATKARRSFTGDSLSDHMALLKVYQEWSDAKLQRKHKQFCEKSVINGATMELISSLRTKFITELRSVGLIRTRGITELKDLNVNSEKWHVVKAVMFCGFYPNITRVDRQVMVLRSSKEAKLQLHPQSALMNGGGKEGHFKALKELPTDWVMYEEMKRLGRMCYIRNNTTITGITVALFGGPLRLLPNALRATPLDDSEDSEGYEDDEPRDAEKDVSYLAIDDWIVFKSQFNDGLAILLLREKFAAMMIRRMQNPSKSIMPGDSSIIDTIIDLLAKEEYRAGLALQTGIWQPQENTNYRGETSRYNENDVQKAYSNSSYRPGNSPYYIYVGNNNKPRNNHFNVKDKKSYNTPKHMPNTRMDKPQANESNENRNARYFFVKASSQKMIEESQNIGKWNFIPGTERNIVNSFKSGFKTILIFSVGNATQKFFGFAEFILATPEGNPPTIYPVKWISRAVVSHNVTRHLINSLDDNRRVGGSRDGVEISYECATSLMDLMDPARSIKSLHS